MTLLAAYNFDEASGSVIDVTGNGHDFALTGGLTRTTTGGADPTGYAGRGLGTSDGFADAGPAIFGQTSNRTICFWLRSTAAFQGWIWEMHNTAGTTGRWGQLALNSVGQGFRGTNASTSAHAVRAAVTDSTWHFWAGTYDGTNVRLYFGTTIGGGLALADTKALSGPLRTDADKILVFDTAGSGNIIRHVRVYDEALDLTALTALMGSPVTAATSVTGTLAGTLPAVTGSVTATAKAAGSLTGSMGQLTGSVAAQVRASGTVAGTLPALTGALTGTVITATVTGQLAGTLPALQGTLTGSAKLTGQLAGVLPSIQGNVAAAATAAGQIAGQLAAITATFTGTARATGSLAGTMHALVAALTGTVGEPAPYDPVTDPVASVRPNDATALPRDNPATAVIRANPAEAAP